MGIGTETGSRLISIGTAVPEFAALQNTILHFMQNAYQEDTASRKLNALFHQSGIDTRYSVIPDFAYADDPVLFPESNGVPHLSERINVYKEKALPLASMAISKSFENINTTLSEFGITHLITVSCTGLHSPGLDAELIGLMNLPDDIFHTSLNFIGCNAAFPALKIADLIVKSQSTAKVLIVCVELCTLHFQPKNNNDNLLSNTIFGDGAAAAIVVSDTFASDNFYKGLTIEGFYSTLLPRGKNLMGWNVTPINFEMILDANVPAFLGEELDDTIAKITKRLAFSVSNIHHWAVHPGGKKILDTFRQKLKLTDNELKHSYSVLQKYGNMSSPSILFVLFEVLSNGTDAGQKVFSIGFGPGISIESALMTVK